MKKFNRVIPCSLLFVLAATAGPAFSQSDHYPEFWEADMDGDGALSIAEFKEALPSISITDANGDGMVNKSEVAAAIPGLMFAPSEGGDGLIGASEYVQIVVSVLRLGGQQEDS
jgi:hypothetical protein